MYFHGTTVVLPKMPWCYFCVAKCNTNLTDFMTFVQQKLLRETKANLLNVSWLASLIPTKKKKNNLLSKNYHPAVNRCHISCRKGKIQPEKNISKFPSAWIWEDIEGKEKKLFQIISNELHEGWLCQKSELQAAQYVGQWLVAGPSTPGVQVASLPPWPALGCDLAVPTGCTLFRAYYYKKSFKRSPNTYFNWVPLKSVKLKIYELETRNLEVKPWALGH